MPTIFSHAVVGFALARAARGVDDRPHLARRRELLAAVLPVLPDLDVVAFSLGIPYGHPLGHRGLSHALLVAAVLGLGAWLLLRRWGAGDGAPGAGALDLIVLMAAAASHGLLDMATDGGLGVAVLAPLDDRRLFWPARPIPVSPIGVGSFLRRGLPVLAWEVALLWPLALAGWAAGASRPRLQRALAAGGALALLTGAWAWRLGGGS